MGTFKLMNQSKASKVGAGCLLFGDISSRSWKGRVCWFSRVTLNLNPMPFTSNCPQPPGGSSPSNSPTRPNGELASPLHEPVLKPQGGVIAGFFLTWQSHWLHWRSHSPWPEEAALKRQFSVFPELQTTPYEKCRTAASEGSKSKRTQGFPSTARAPLVLMAGGHWAHLFCLAPRK